jgi:hypothetical protein
VKLAKLDRPSGRLSLVRAKSKASSRLVKPKDTKPVSASPLFHSRETPAKPTPEAGEGISESGVLHDTERRRLEETARPELEDSRVLEEEIALLGQEQVEARQVDDLLVRLHLGEVGVHGRVEHEARPQIPLEAGRPPAAVPAPVAPAGTARRDPVRRSRRAAGGRARSAILPAAESWARPPAAWREAYPQCASGGYSSQNE